MIIGDEAGWQVWQGTFRECEVQGSGIQAKWIAAG